MTRTAWMASVALGVVLVVVLSPLSFAAQAPAPAPAPAPAAAPAPAESAGPTLENPPEKQTIGELLFNVRHYILIGDFPAATKYIRALLARNPKPGDLVKAIDADDVLKDRDSGLMVVVMRAAKAEDADLRKAAQDLLDKIESGFVETEKDPEIIKQLIADLDSPRLPVQESAKRHLREMAPWSIPMMIHVLVDESQAARRPSVILALAEMGLGAVDPLCEALDMAEMVPAKINVVQALAKIGYPQAIPYVAALGSQTKSDQLKDVCKSAVEVLSRSPRAGFTGAPAHMFVQLGDAYFSDTPSLRPIVKGPTVPVWRMDPKIGVVSVAVPRAIFKEVMAMRSFVRALRLDSNQPEAIALWIAANIRKEAELAGAKDPTVPAGTPGAQYVAAAAGPSYLLRALSRAVADNDAVVAFGLVKALNDIGFPHSAGADINPLAMALQFPDRRVRYEAALVYATAHFRTQLTGSELVVSTLADAIAQTGDKYALALLPESPETAKLLAQVREAGYRVDSVTARKDVFDRARSVDIPHVDLLVVAYDTQEGGLAGLEDLRKDFRLRHIPTLLVATVADKAETATKDMTGLGIIQYSASAGDVKAKVAKIQGQSGDVGMTADEAKAYALRSAKALREVALSNPPGMNFAMAIPALVRALNDPRTELAVAAGEALGYADDAQAQRSVAQAALEDKDPARKVAAFKALAASAKRFGNKLTDDQVNAVIKAAMDEPNLDVRTAAAQAMGALNLPSVKIDALILKMSPTL